MTLSKASPLGNTKGTLLLCHFSMLSVVSGDNDDWERAYVLQAGALGAPSRECD